MKNEMDLVPNSIALIKSLFYFVLYVTKTMLVLGKSWSITQWCIMFHRVIE